ncbi:MAG TPA: phosphodiester glycosidase family protein [Stenomitos sp.]
MNACRSWIAIGLAWALGPQAVMAQPVAIARKHVSIERRSVPLVVVAADLRDGQTLVSLRFAHGGVPQHRCHESFADFARHAHAAAVVNGTFFSVSTYDTLGNTVIAGRLVQHRDWDTRGTALTIARDGRARIRTLRTEGLPDYHRAWLSFAAGPRLVKEGKVWLRPWFEGFRDPALFGRHPRTALGLTRDGRRMLLVSFPTAISLQEEAEAMRQLGVHDALNLDGGPSVGMAYRGKLVATPLWGITNALVLYDRQYPAPVSLQQAYRLASEHDAGASN